MERATVLDRRSKSKYDGITRFYEMIKEDV